jgi:hypothetical protein
MIEIRKRGSLADVHRPVVLRGLVAYLFDLIEGKGAERFVDTTICNAIPCGRNAARGRRDLEDHHSLPLDCELVNSGKRCLVVRVSGDLFFLTLRTLTPPLLLFFSPITNISIEAPLPLPL